MTPEADDGAGLAPDEAFGLLGNDTRVAILQALWDTFESGMGNNTLSYSELFEEVDYHDSGNFSYHLEKLTGPFIRQTAEGYKLKQTGINVLRAVVTGTVIDDPEFGPTEIDVTCPMCGGPVEVEYKDEVMTVTCTDCAGMLQWNDEPGILFIGFVPPSIIDDRSIAGAFRAAVAFSMFQIAALYNGVCPHCSGEPDRRLEVCRDHDPGTASLCPNCDRHHLAEARMVCRTCKWRAFPPVALAVVTEPAVIAFYHEHGIEHRFPSWEGLIRCFHFEEELVSEDPLRLRCTVPVDDDRLQLTLDGDVNVIEVTG